MKRLGFNKKGNASPAPMVDLSGIHSEIAELKTQMTASKALAEQAKKTADESDDWQIVSTVTDLNALTETGRYFIQAAGNTNAPITDWVYVVVDKAKDDRIIQEVWADSNSSLRYARVFNSSWRGWEKSVTLNELNHRLNSSFYVGGRNLILRSGQAVTGEGQKTINFGVVPDVEFLYVRQLTLSVDVKYINARKATQSGAKWFRMGAEVLVRYTDNSTHLLSCWRFATDTPTSFVGRLASRLTVPSGKVVKALENAKIQIFDVLGSEVVVKNPKLEFGLVQTDWTPAFEDFALKSGNG